MATGNSPVMKAQMRIRKPPAEVFEAFIDPAITKNFWFTKSSGKLEKGKTITWTWEMYGHSTEVKVQEIIPAKKIAILWGAPETNVDFEFQELKDGTTYVVISNYGFSSTGQKLLDELIDTTGGFTTVLDGLKAWLEHGLNLQLIVDKFPRGLSDR